MKKCSKLTHCDLVWGNAEKFACQVRLILLNPAWWEAAGDGGGVGGRQQEMGVGLVGHSRRRGGVGGWWVECTGGARILL